MEGYLKGLWKLALELGLMLALKTVANEKLKKSKNFMVVENYQFYKSYLHVSQDLVIGSG
jgi:hypothetical protein